MAPEPTQDLDRFFLTTVALITTRSSKGDNVMAAEWTFNVSYDPMLVAVSVSARHATHAAIVESGEFGVNMASQGQFALSSFAGGFSHREAEKLTSSGIKTRPGEAIKAFMIEGSLAQLECKLVKQVDLGNHTLFVGEVVAGRANDALEPIVLYRGYRKLGEKVDRGHNLFLTLTNEPGGVRVDGFYYADTRAGQEVHLAAFDAAGGKVAEGTATTDRAGYIEWRTGAAAVVRVTGTAGPASAEARSR